VTTGPDVEFVTDQPRPLWQRELRSAAVVAAWVAASGIPLGLLWYAVAPKVRLVMIGSVPYPTDPEPEAFVADDGWFVFLGLIAGVLAGIGVWILARRHRGPLLLGGLVVGAALSSLLAAWLASRFGLAHYRDLIAHGASGTRFTRPVGLAGRRLEPGFGFQPWMRAAMLVQALAAVAVYTMIASFHPSADLDAEVRRPVPMWPPLSSDWTEPPALPAAPAPPAPGPGGPPPG
jgi:hypothetical protein